LVFGQELIQNKGVVDGIFEGDPANIVALVGSLTTIIGISTFLSLGLGRELERSPSYEAAMFVDMTFNTFGEAPVQEQRKSASEYPVPGYRFNPANQDAVDAVDAVGNQSSVDVISGDQSPHPSGRFMFSKEAKAMEKTPLKSASEYPVQGYRFKPETQNAVGALGDSSPHPDGTFKFSKELKSKEKTPPKSASEFPVVGYRFKPETQSAITTIPQDLSPHPEGSFSFNSETTIAIQSESAGPVEPSVEPLSPAIHPVKGFTFSEPTQDSIRATDRNTSVRPEPSRVDLSAGVPPYWPIDVIKEQIRQPINKEPSQQYVPTGMSYLEALSARDRSSSSESESDTYTAAPELVRARGGGYLDSLTPNSDMRP
jgi:hypothetical protein